MEKEVKMKKLSIILFAMLVIFGTASMASASFTVYTSEAAWQGALSSYFTEDFDDFTTPNVSYATVNGFIDPLPGPGVWHDVLTPGGATTTFNFSFDILAFGGNWDLYGPGGPGTNIDVVVNGTSIYEGSNTYSIYHTYSGGFWGFISTEPFDSVLLTAGADSSQWSPGSGRETYNLDKMVYSAQVPEPAILLLFGAGLLGLGLARKFKQ
jgi:hypothetical protein